MDHNAMRDQAFQEAEGLLVRLNSYPRLISMPFKVGYHDEYRSIQTVEWQVPNVTVSLHGRMRARVSASILGVNRNAQY